MSTEPNIMCSILEKIRAEQPLIVNLTNYVTMDLMANSLLAIGAAPIMSHDEHEFAELVPKASCINVNMGTLDPAFANKTRALLACAHQYNKPVVFDPVGAGASQIRTSLAMECLPHVAIVRGNASEIMALDGKGATRGVDATHASSEAQDAAFRLAKTFDAVVAISGATDIIVSNQRSVSLNFGTPLMTAVTGMGCTLTAITAAFHAVHEDSFQATVAALAFFSLCGEQAALVANAPGSFKTAFIDALYAPNLARMRERL